MRLNRLCHWDFWPREMDSVLVVSISRWVWSVFRFCISSLCKSCSFKYSFRSDRALNLALNVSPIQVLRSGKESIRFASRFVCFLDRDAIFVLTLFTISTGSHLLPNSMALSFGSLLAGYVGSNSLSSSLRSELNLLSNCLPAHSTDWKVLLAYGHFFTFPCCRFDFDGMSEWKLGYRVSIPCCHAKWIGICSKSLDRFVVFSCAELFLHTCCF